MEFERFKSENPVWGHFLHSRSGERETCEICKLTMSCKSGSTRAMRNHLQLKHKIQIDAKKTFLVPFLCVTVGVSIVIRLGHLFRPSEGFAVADRISFNTVDTN